MGIRIIFMISILTLVQCEIAKKSKPLTAPISEESNYYHGTKLQDSYLYLESQDDSTFINWIKSQDKFSHSVLGSIPNKSIIKQQIELFNEKTELNISQLRVTEDGTYFYVKKRTHESFNKLYTRNGYTGSEELLFNSREFYHDSSENYLINYIQPSWDGSKIAISLSKNDEEFSELIIYDIKTKQILKDKIDHIWPNSLGGIDWLSNNSSFIYTHVPVIDSKNEDYLLNTKVFLYNIGGKKLSNDILSKKNNPRLNINTEDFPTCYLPYSKSKYIIAQIGGANFYRDTYFTRTSTILDKKPSWQLLFSKDDKIIQYQVKGNELYFLSSKDASNFKICKTSLLRLNISNPEIIINEDPTAVISDFCVTKDGLYYTKIKNGVDTKLFLFIHGKEENIQLPKMSGFVDVNTINFSHNNIWIQTEGWTSDKERYLFDYEENRFVEKNIASIKEYKELDDVIVEEVEVKSHDGTKVPLSIIYQKGITRNSKNRVLMGSYGAYGISITPRVYDYLLHWVLQGGIYAEAHVRGGGEKGEAWRKGGYKTTKPNTWKDFIACTEYLIENNYTESDKTAVWSGSAGGICIGRAITERPDLYTAAIIRVGVFNTIRSEFAPNGKNNTKEFGTVKDSIEFRALYEMDSYHHVKDGVKYPAVLLTAGLKDARVPAWQPAKFAARLIAANASDKPVLLSVDFEGGHGFEADINKKKEETTNIISFALWQTGHPDYQPK